MRDRTVDIPITTLEELSKERRDKTVVGRAVEACLELIEAMYRVEIFFREPVARLTVVWIGLPVLKKLEVATIATLVAIAHATCHVDAILKEVVLDGSDWTRMHKTLHRSRESTRIVDWRSELHHALAPHLDHELAPALNPFRVLSLGHVIIKPIPSGHS